MTPQDSTPRTATTDTGRDGGEHPAALVLVAPPQQHPRAPLLTSGHSRSVTEVLTIGPQAGDTILKLEGHGRDGAWLWLPVTPTSKEDKDADPDIRLQLFGQVAIVANGEQTIIASKRSAELLGALAAAAPKPISAEALAEQLWTAQDVSVNAVYTAISRLRSQLKPIGASELLVRDGHGYSLSIGGENIDIIKFERVCKTLMQSSRRPGSAELLDLARSAQPIEMDMAVNGRFASLARRVNETRLQLLETLASRLLDELRPDDAVAVCREVLGEESGREPAWALLVLSLYRSGNAVASLNTLDEARVTLREEIGLDPGPSLAQLELSILNRDPRLNSDEWAAVLDPYSSNDQ